jgi:hypothetical protein
MAGDIKWRYIKPVFPFKATKACILPGRNLARDWRLHAAKLAQPKQSGLTKSASI